MIRVLFGVALWTLVQHQVHASWHRMGDRGSAHFFAIGERAHHRLWHALGVVPDDDRPGLYLNPPWWVAGGLVVVVFALGWVIGWRVGVGFLLGAVTDLGWHVSMHRWARPRWLARFHRRHHEAGLCNYGLGAGLLWDRLLGTYKAP